MLSTTNPPHLSHLPLDPSKFPADPDLLSPQFAITAPKAGEQSEVGHEELGARLDALLKGKVEGEGEGRWTLVLGGKGVRRDVRFRTFRETWVSFSGLFLLFFGVMS